MRLRTLLLIALAGFLSGCGIHPDVFKQQNMEQIAKRQTYGLSQQEGTATVRLFNGAYTGALQNGLFHGQGQFKWDSGHTYQGMYVNGQMQGQGTFTWPDGTRYVGTFSNGRRDGNGDIFWRDGSIFSGTFSSGNLVGEGTLRLRNKSSISGTFIQNNDETNTAGITTPESGKITFTDGTSFEGEIASNYPGIEGIYLTASGTLRQGSGTCYTESGTENCRFADGRRVDDLYLVRIERIKLQRMMAGAQQQKLTAQGARNDVPKSKIPQPIMNNSGRYMSPYTQDGVMADWCDMAINAKIGATAGGTAGAVAGGVAGNMIADQLLSNVPFGGLFGGIAGGIVGNQAGKAAGKSIALDAAGGIEKVRATSDMSFNNLRDMSIYLYAMHSNHQHYKAALEIAMEIYPELKDSYYGYISGY